MSRSTAKRRQLGLPLPGTQVELVLPKGAPVLTDADLRTLHETATTPGVRGLWQSLIDDRAMRAELAAEDDRAEERRTRKAAVRDVSLAVQVDEDEAAAEQKPRGVRAELLAAKAAKLARALTFKHGDAVSAPGHPPLVVEHVGMSAGRPDGTVLCRLASDPPTRKRNFWFASTALSRRAP